MDLWWFWPIAHRESEIIYFLGCCCLVAKSCLTLCNHIDCSLLGSSVHRISRQEPWSGLPFCSQGFFPTQGLNSSLLRCRRIFYCWVTREVHRTRSKKKCSLQPTCRAIYSGVLSHQMRISTTLRLPFCEPPSGGTMRRLSSRLY